MMKLDPPVTLIDVEPVGYEPDRWPIFPVSPNGQRPKAHRERMGLRVYEARRMLGLPMGASIWGLEDGAQTLFAEDWARVLALLEALPEAEQREPKSLDVARG